MPPTNVLPEFELVHIDVTAAGENTDRIEVWPEMEYAYNVYCIEKRGCKPTVNEESL